MTRAIRRLWEDASQKHPHLLALDIATYLVVYLLLIGWVS